MLRDGRFSVTILEQDESSFARIQGFTLGVNPVGSQALKELGLIDQLAPHVTGSLHYARISRADGTKLLEYRSRSTLGGDQNISQEEGKKQLIAGRGIINRGLLRQVMLEEIKRLNGKILWSAKLEEVNVEGNGVRVTLEKGSDVHGDFVLGCDGIFSKTRESIAKKGYTSKSQSLRHLNVAWVRGFCLNRDQLQYDVLNKSFGAAFVDQDGNAFTIECPDGKTLSWYFAFRMEEGLGPKRSDPPEAIANEVLRRIENTKQWEPLVSQILQDSLEFNKDGMVFRHLYDRTPEDIETWSMQDNIPITLLGDAFHPVASYSGAGGGSNALRDGVEVAKELILSQNAQALRRFEGPMRERSVKSAKLSGSLTKFFHSGWLAGRIFEIIFRILRAILNFYLWYTSRARSKKKES